MAGCYRKTALALESLLLSDVELPDDLDLTKPERRMWTAVTAGEACNLGDGDPRKLASPGDWGTDRKIRGHVLAELLIRSRTDELPDVRQVRIRGARVSGKVDLRHTEVAAAVHFECCVFTDNVILEFARTRPLRLDTCVLASVKARGVSIDGVLRIRRSDVQGSIFLIDATVSQSVRLSGSTIAGDDGLALIADRLKVGGNVFLNRFSTKSKHRGEVEAFSAAGEVRLLGARIDGQLNCSGGRFKNPGEIALSASSAQIGGNMFLNDGFKAAGQVRLLSTRIGGQLNCSGSRFKNPGKTALKASSARVSGSVFLRDGFRATGEVRLLSARIGGQLNCSDGRFKNPRRVALSASSSDISRSVFLRDGFHSTGAVRLVGTKIGGRLNCRSGRFDNPGRTALDLQEVRMTSLVLRGPGLQMAGDVHLFGAKTSTLADDPVALEGQSASLNLDGFVYERFAPSSPQDVSTRLQWLERQPEGYHPQPFDQLTAVFRRSGQDQEARDVLIAKRRKRRGTFQGRPSKGWDAFLDWSVRYGWQPWRPLVGGSAFFLIVMGFVSAAQAAGLVVSLSEEASAYNSFIHTLDVFLPIVDLSVESRWMIDTSNNDSFAWLVTWLLWALKLVGWGTVTLALAALTGIVKRE